MRKDQIKVGGLYKAKVNGREVTVRVDAIDYVGDGFRIGGHGRRGRQNTTAYRVINLDTGRKTTFKSAASFRCEVESNEDRLALPAGTYACLGCGRTVEMAEGDTLPRDDEYCSHEFERMEDEEACEAGPFAQDAVALASTDSTAPATSNTDGLTEDEQAREELDAQTYGHFIPKKDERCSDPTPGARPVGGELEAPSSPSVSTARTGSADSFAQQIAATLSPTHQPGRVVAGMVPNEEQEAILALVADMYRKRHVGDRPYRGGVMVTCAGAGAGKTATLKMIEQTLNGRGQYTAFNRSIVDDSRPKFVRASVNTTHALASRGTGFKYHHRLPKKGTRKMRTSEVAVYLGIKPMTVLLKGAGPPDENGKPTDKERNLSAEFLTGQVMCAVKRFVQSADRDVTPKHFHYINGIDNPGSLDNNAKVRDCLLPFARKAWEDLNSIHGQLPYWHDCYVKSWQLGEGVDRPVIGADYILLDEAQDTAPVFLDIIKQQQALVVLVGDDNQQIYEWRGATNAMSAFPGVPRCLLSQSYRFGQAIADVANTILATLDEPTDLVMRGHPDIPSRVAEVLEPRCYLYRTNAGAVSRIMMARKEGKRGHLIGNASEVIEFCKAALCLQASPPQKTDHFELGCFDTWEEVLEHAASDEGAELRLMCKLIKTFGAKEIIEALTGMPDEGDADLVVSTAHKSKGREWESVKLGGDFPLPNKMSDPDRRLLYVAATRAKLTLDVSECPPFCGGQAKASEGLLGQLGEGGWIPGLAIRYTKPMPTAEAQAEWLARKASEGSARPGKPPSRAAVASGAEDGSGSASPARIDPGPAGGPGNGNGGNGAGSTPPDGPAVSFTWSKTANGWGVRGPANMEGQHVTVTRKDGSTSRVQLGERVASYGNIWVYEV